MIITERKIYMLGSTPRHLDDGFSLQRNGKVNQLRFKNDEKSIQAVVEDDDSHPTFIQFNSQNNISSYHCDCQEARHLNGACKHVIATLKQAQIVIDESRKTQALQEASIHEILNSFSDALIMDTISKQSVKIEVYLRLIQDDIRFVANLYLKIGLDKMYIVKNLRELLEAFDLNDEIDYGKSFTLIPEYHQLPKSLKEFFKVIQDIHEEGHDYYRTPKELLLNEHYLKKILKSLNQHSIYMEGISTHIIQVFINDDPFIGPIKIKGNQHRIELDLSGFERIIPITRDFHYILYDQQVFYLNNELRNQYTPFLKAAKQTQTRLVFRNNDLQTFITKVIPFLPNEIEVPDDIRESYFQLPLVASLYLDKTNQSIIATPMFKYGNFEFNPIKTNDVIVLNNKLLIRELNKEEELLNLLGHANFKVQPEHFYIDDEEDVIYFVEKYLPILKNNMEIYYSDTFKAIVKKRSLKSTIRYNESLNLFEVNFGLEGVAFGELKEIMRSYKLKQKYYRLLDGSFISLDDKQTQEFIQSMEYFDIDLDKLRKPNVSLTISEALFLNASIDLDDNDGYFKTLVEQIGKQTLPTFSIDSSLQPIMREYQVVGFNWLKTLSQYHLGGVLADDMGLGKTLQTIAFLKDECRINTKPNLIVCPTSLVYNWEDELKRFAPDLRYLIISGNVASRKELIKQISDYQIIITSYPLLRKDIEHYDSFHFNHCILDEAQYIKNSSSQNARTVKLIRANTRYALTGTPMENSLEELWSIFDFVMPGMLLTHQKFRTLYEIPIVKDQNRTVQKRLINRIKPFILRRMKTEVLTELPDKIESKYSIDLLAEQKELYLATLEQTRKDIHSEIKNEGLQKSHIKIFAALIRLRQLCNHPSLFLDNYYGSSGKLDALNEIVDEALSNSSKILIFSQFTSMLHLIEDQLKLKEINYSYLDGSTPMEQRQKQVKEFNEGDVPIFLISLKAGGTGLNLTGANMVIHVDPWWNPAVEQQATDRAYRLGQTKNVQVIKLISKGTIEEKIYELQQSKQSLIDSIIQPGETLLSKLSENEILDLFK